jgi:hypothetical protein
MRAPATLLLALGTIVGTLGGAHLPKTDWRIVIAGLALLALGAGLMRRRSGAEVSSLHRAGREVLASVAALPDRIDVLVADAPSLDFGELRQRLDQLELEAIRPVAEASVDLLPSLGAARFAAVFGAFASAERSLARAWSAAADRHRPETLAALAHGAERAREAAAAARDAS